MYINAQGVIYVGDMAVGDREATPAEIEAWRLGASNSIAAIQAQLSQIDSDSQRPARVVALALVKGLAVPAFELSKLESLETRAEELRAERKALPEG